MLIIKHNAKFVNRLLMFSALCLFFTFYFYALYPKKFLSDNASAHPPCFG